MIAAREEATTAAGAALKRLAIAAKEFPPYLTPAEKALRSRLRAAARQLGDSWNADKQTFAALNRLTHEVAYEHWHRMLFARFLAENNLLMHPEHGVPVELSTVAELAQEEAAKVGTKPDTWALAGRFASGMLPQIFRPDDPALAVQLAPEHQQALEKILESLPSQVFTADDALGWVYQFWQSAEKERVNSTVKAGAKITGETLPAVTQLFTEHYMVLFLLHNTVGAWHAAKQIAKMPPAKTSAWQNEADVRAAVALPDYTFDYLRFVKDDASGAWRPAAGAFDGWPKSAKELKVLDPCCGSGHFLVAALELLTHLRMAEEGLDTKAAVHPVITDNLFGLELDARCTQIAAFNVALAAWKFAGDHVSLPELHIACSGLAPNCTVEQWLKLADGRIALKESPLERSAIRNTLRDMHELFSKAPELGSLIDPSATAGTLGSADWETAAPFLATVLTEERKGSDDDTHERAVAAQGMAKAAEILSGEYTLVTTNVPYLGRAGQGDKIKAFCEAHYPEAKADLATVFVSRIMQWLAEGGTTAVVTPQNCLFLTSYKKLRERLLKERTWNMVARLGPKGFQTPMWDFNVMLAIMSGGKPLKDHIMAGIDVATAKRPAEKAMLLRGEAIVANAPAEHKLSSVEAADDSVPPGSTDGSIKFVPQSDQFMNANSRILLETRRAKNVLSEYAGCYAGLNAADIERFVRYFWDFATRESKWQFMQNSFSNAPLYGGMSEMILWEGGHGDYYKFVAEKLGPSGVGAWIRGEIAWGKRGIVIVKMNALPSAVYVGDKYGANVYVIIPKSEEHLLPILAYARHPEFVRNCRQVDQKTDIANHAVLDIPFDLGHWQNVAAEKFPNGLPEPQSDDPTQWIFHGHPAGRVPLTHDPNAHLATVLQVAVARIAGYRWPAELDENMRLAPGARAWVDKCKTLEKFADDDGVVPLVPINKEPPGSERVRTLLEAAFCSQWSPGLLHDLLAAAGSDGKNLDEWVKHDFFAQHCAVFHQRPFVWQIWDTKKDGFNILVHYHRLAEGNGKGKKLLEKITYTYLGDWITQQQAGAKRGETGADTRLKAAQDLQKKLEAIITGEPPFDIFVRWKPLHEQPIGWNPDINDGVRMNIRPFITAGVLRGKVNVKWKKDRGKEPESIRPKAQFPWFWNCPEDAPPIDYAGGPEFTGERLNDLHYTIKAKQAARDGHISLKS